MEPIGWATQIELIRPAPHLIRVASGRALMRADERMAATAGKQVASQHP
jgi:hypothetical protein